MDVVQQVEDKYQTTNGTPKKLKDESISDCLKGEEESNTKMMGNEWVEFSRIVEKFFLCLWFLVIIAATGVLIYMVEENNSKWAKLG